MYFLIVSLLLSCGCTCREDQTIHCWLVDSASLGVHTRHSNRLHGQERDRQDTCFLLTRRERSKINDVSMAQTARAAQEASEDASFLLSTSCPLFPFQDLMESEVFCGSRSHVKCPYSCRTHWSHLPVCTYLDLAYVIVCGASPKGLHRHCSTSKNSIENHEKKQLSIVLLPCSCINTTQMVALLIMRLLGAR